MLEKQLDDLVPSFGGTYRKRRKIGPIAVLTKIRVCASVEQDSRQRNVVAAARDEQGCVAVVCAYFKRVGAGAALEQTADARELPRLGGVQ
jgi:hypothetical protein